jgi:hypothetical protein
MVYITGMNRIRHFFHEAAPASRPYFVLPIYDWTSTSRTIAADCIGAEPSTGTTRPFDRSALTSRRLATYPKNRFHGTYSAGAGHVSAPQLGAAADAGHIGNCS